MLRETEVIGKRDGTLKALADFINETIVLTPTTPVHTSDDSDPVMFEDYIKSLLNGGN